MQTKSINAIISTDRRFVNIQIKNEQLKTLIVEVDIEIQWNSLTLVDDPSGRRTSTYARRPSVFGNKNLINQTPRGGNTAIMFPESTPRAAGGKVKPSFRGMGL